MSTSLSTFAGAGMRMVMAGAIVAGNLMATARAVAADDRPQPDKLADVPVKRVVIFSSGVTYYEHNGEVEGNAQLDMQFKIDNINDLLKSMVLQDLGGGQISTVNYGSKDPITRTLKTFSIDLTDEPTLSDLLRQVRGERVELEGPSKIVGTILGVDKKKIRVKDEVIEVESLTLLTEEGLRSVPMDSIGRIKLLNPKLDAELRQALTMLAASHSTDKKTVSLKFNGKGKRSVSVGYVQESPIWKTSYRLVLDEKDKPQLQGWAIVENTTESDWKDVNLALVSGRPISFTMDLYEPLYVSRPEVKPELYASLRPRTYDQDLAGRERDFKAAESTIAPLNDRADGDVSGTNGQRVRQWESLKKRSGELYSEGYVETGKELVRDQQKQKLSLESVKPAAVGGDVGELFRYQIAAPVSLERGRSAMLPIVNQPVDGEKVSIYNASVHVKHPLNGLRLKNTTQLNLMQGPITVFDDGAYAGDAQIASLAPGTERLISYAMDLDTEVAPTSKYDPQQMVSCKIEKGILIATYKNSRTQSYVIKNSGKKAKQVLVEYPLETDWKLIAPKEATEKTRDLYRFAVTAEPGKPASLEIKEERQIAQTIYVSNIDDNSIKLFLASQVVSDKVKAALQEAIKQKRGIEAASKAREELQRQAQVIEQEQARIRQNMAQLDKDTDLYRRYVTKFGQQEDQIEQLREKVTASLKTEEGLRKSLDAYLLNLDVGQ